MPNEQDPEAIKAAMDAAAKIAGEALAKLDKKSVAAVAGWMAENYAKAGYKRLSKQLVAIAKAAAPAKADKKSKKGEEPEE